MKNISALLFSFYMLQYDDYKFLSGRFKNDLYKYKR